MIIAHPEPDNVSIVVSVVDTGPGMSEEVRQSLFTERVVSHKPGGTGLGTKIVKDVVDSHGGEISVDSQMGVGTTFNIRLPIHPPLPQSKKNL
jgi:signal transduction histidine kinase